MWGAATNSSSSCTSLAAIERSRPARRGWVAVLLSAALACSCAGPLRSGRDRVPSAPCGRGDFAACSAGCQRSNLGDCSILGGLYLSGAGVAKDPPRAVGLLRRGCDGGVPFACHGLALAELSGTGTARDLAAALRHLQAVCNSKQTYGCETLGKVHLQGNQLPRSPEQARAAFQVGCEGGDAKSCFQLGFMHSNGIGVP